MPRIRTIKPEFWTDSVVVQLPFEARLLFVGLWNFCDDQGFFGSEPDRLRMQVFPSEPSIDVASLLDLLVAADRLEMYVAASGEWLLKVKNFEKHQRVDNPSKPRFVGAKKRSIPQSVRRAVAEKYGCAPGEEKAATCFYCGAAGSIHWWRHHSGKPSAWVSFSLELDHVESEAAGGDGEAQNIVLACRACNRSKGVKEFAEMWPSLAIPREPSTLEGKRKGKGKGRGSDLPPLENAAAPTAAVWDSYSDAFEQRHGVKPPDSAKTRSQLKQFLGRVPADDAPAIAAFFLTHNDALYVRSKHAIDLLLRDATKLYAEWQTGRQVTSMEARQIEKTQENLDGWMALEKRPKHGVV